jgi:hypothetical protein
LSPYRDHFRAAPRERRGDAFGCSIGDDTQGIVGWMRVARRHLWRPMAE